MNGIHDLGGMHGFGPINPEPNEPVFHEPWEARVYAINRTLSSWRKWNIDAGRHAVELLPPADYLRMSYYEKWLERNLQLLAQHGLATPEEIAAAQGKRVDYSRPDANVQPRFHPGDRVRTRNINPEGHTRLPRYARGHECAIIRDHGIFVFPDTNAHCQGENPQHLYSVHFTARELWGQAASERDSIHLDLWESYLDPA
jgi:hypothetical protein